MLIARPYNEVKRTPVSPVQYRFRDNLIRRELCERAQRGPYLLQRVKGDKQRADRSCCLTPRVVDEIYRAPTATDIHRISADY